MNESNNIIMLAKSTPEYKAVEKLYDNRRECATRSGVPKINHIDEGLVVLSILGADLTTMRAWCLHPIIQSDDDMIRAFNPEYHADLFGFDWQALGLAVEYRNCANLYLCRVDTDEYTKQDLPSIPLDQVYNMLIADKVQNKKDFMTYHLNTHERSDQLCRYFDMWLDHLYISTHQYDSLCRSIDAAKLQE